MTQQRRRDVLIDFVKVRLQQSSNLNRGVEHCVWCNPRRRSVVQSRIVKPFSARLMKTWKEISVNTCGTHWTRLLNVSRKGLGRWGIFWDLVYLAYVINRVVRFIDPEDETCRRLDSKRYRKKTKMPTNFVFFRYHVGVDHICPVFWWILLFGVFDESPERAIWRSSFSSS